MDYQTGDDFSGSSFLSEPGTYHLMVQAIDEAPTNNNGQLIDGALFRAQCSVLAGTVAGQEDKEVALTYFAPKPSAKDGGKFGRKKVDRFLLAVGLIGDDAKGKQVAIDLQAAIGRHFIAHLEGREYDGKTYLEVAFADTFHVDSAEAKSYPKNENAMKLPAPWRKVSAKPAAATNGRPAAALADVL